MMISREQTYFEGAFSNFLDPSSDQTPETLIGELTGTTQSSEIGALEAIGILRRWFDQLEPKLVAQAKADGFSRFDIARALGVTRQAIWKKYAYLGDFNADPGPADTDG